MGKIQGESMVEFVCICGIDGVGKTTIAKELAKRLGYIYVKTPPQSYQTIREHYEHEGVSAFSRFCFYLGALYESSERIRTTLRLGQGVVVDRYLLSVQVYHEAMIKRDLGRFIELVDFVKPDLNIILQASMATVAKRLKDRGNHTFDHKLENNESFLNKVAEKFATKTEGSAHIICDNKSIDDVVEECLTLISKAEQSYEERKQ